MWLTAISGLWLALAGQAAQPAAPQRPMLWLGTQTFHSDRAGGPSSSSGKALSAGQLTPFATYLTENMCGFAAGGFSQIDPAAVLGWEVTAVPKVVRPNEVILAVTWNRIRNRKSEARGSIEVLIRSGDTVPIDVVGIPEAQLGSGCHMTSAQLTLELNPVGTARQVAGMSSVVSTDMWLVRRLPDGREETQQINVRGAMNESVPFYFDDIKAGDIWMAVSGKVRAREGAHGAVALEFEAERGVRNAVRTLERGATAPRPDTGLLTFNSDRDVVSVEFPRTSNGQWGDLVKQPLAIRIQTRRIR
jgi:hypothetical protein